MSPFLIFLAILGGLIVAIGVLVASRFKVAGPNEAFIVTGRKGRAVTNPETGETAGIAIRVDNALLFDLNSANLRPGVRADLADLASSLRNYNDHDAVIVGHASTDGPADHNQTLSERRAAAVREYLVSLGVDAYRLEAFGRGETDPLPGVAGTSPENRRVEIAIYANENYRQDLQNQYGN